MQRHYVKLLLRTAKTNTLGQHPIYLRITLDRKVSFSATGYWVHPGVWDKKAEMVKSEHPMAEEINRDITDKKRQVLSELVNAGVKGKRVSAQEIKARTAAGANDIFLFTAKYIKELGSHGKRAEGTLENYEKHLNKLKEFAGESLTFEEITTDYLNRFETHLRNGGVDRVVSKGRDGSNYIVAIMKTIRRMFNAAIRQELTANYPFKNYEFPDYTPDEKEYLTIPELDQWTAYYKQATAKGQRQTALYFLFGCYTGLRISDWYKFDRRKHLVGDEYIRLRAKKNGEWVIMPLHDRLRWVLQEIKTVPLTTNEKSLVAMMLYVSKKAGIQKHLSSHSARKTFAVTLCADRGISLEVCAELMGITLEVCRDNYYRITPQKIQGEALRAWKDM